MTQTIHGNEWELLQGQELPLDSEVRNFWTDSHLPDARGGDLFISRSRDTCEHPGGFAGGMAFGNNGAAGITRDELTVHHKGGVETRPRNISVNAFIKVRETPPAVQPQMKWTQEQITELLKNPDFQNGLIETIQNARRAGR